MTKELIQEELTNLDSLISNKEIKFIVKILSKKKTLGLHGFVRISKKKWLREEIIQILHKLSQRIE